MKTYYLMRIAAVVVRFVPPRLAYWLCSMIGTIVFAVTPGVRDSVLDNLGHVLPKASKRTRRKIGRKIVRNVIKNYYDLLRLPNVTKEYIERNVVLEGLEHLNKALAAGNGVIMFGAHLGNYSMVAQIAVTLGFKMSIITEDIEPPKLYDYVNSIRGRFGLRMIKLGSAQVRTIYKLVRNNEGLMLASDRDVNEDGVPTIFFDAIADMPPGPVALALRLNTAFIPAHSYRCPDNTSVVQIGPPIELVRTGDRDLDLKVNMRKVAQVMEEQILQDPTQWVVLQKIWDRDYTGLEANEAQVEAIPQKTEGPLPEPIPVASLNLTTPQPESANPPGLPLDESRNQKSEVRANF